MKTCHTFLLGIFIVHFCGTLILATAPIDKSEKELLMDKIITEYNVLSKKLESLEKSSAKLEAFYKDKSWEKVWNLRYENLIKEMQYFVNVEVEEFVNKLIKSYENEKKQAENATMLTENVKSAKLLEKEQLLQTLVNNLNKKFQEIADRMLNKGEQIGNKTSAWFVAATSDLNNNNKNNSNESSTLVNALNTSLQSFESRLMSNSAQNMNNMTNILQALTAHIDEKLAHFAENIKQNYANSDAQKHKEMSKTIAELLDNKLHYMPTATTPTVTPVETETSEAMNAITRKKTTKIANASTSFDAFAASSGETATSQTKPDDILKDVNTTIPYNNIKSIMNEVNTTNETTSAEVGEESKRTPVDRFFHQLENNASDSKHTENTINSTSPTSTLPNLDFYHILNEKVEDLNQIVNNHNDTAWNVNTLFAIETSLMQQNVNLHEKLSSVNDAQTSDDSLSL